MRSILTALQEGRLFELPEAGKDRALEFLARILDANPEIEVGTDAIEEIKRREIECNTGIGVGVAVPHIRARREAGELFCAIGWSAQGIDYGAEDGQPVRLVFMFYVPGAQKNVYLKEVSNLVKAIRRSGLEQIERAAELSVVRNLLLDWVGVALGEAGPESVARMIRLEVKHAQAPETPPATPEHAPTPVIHFPAGARAAKLTVITLGPTGILVLTPDAELCGILERDESVIPKLSAGPPFQVAGRTIYVVDAVDYPGGRTAYECFAVSP
jgi:nitrogen PTS system EIIA component